MSYDFDKRTSFSVEGSRWRRLNPDGTYPDVDRQIGFSGTIDISDLTSTDVLSYRENAQGDFTDLTIDLTSAADDDTAATVSEIVTALNADTGFAALFTASQDSDTERLLIELTDTTDITYLELKGTIATTLFFGGYESGDTGFGTHFIDCFDDSGAIGLSKEITDFDEEETESGDGTTISMITSALLKGLNPTLALNDELFELKELIQGGTNDQSLDDIENRYTPPTTEQTYLPGFAGEVYEARYEKGSNLRNNMAGYKRVNLNNCNGIESDLSDDVKSWATYSFDIKVREYKDLNGDRQPGYTEDSLTKAQFDALGITVG